MINWYPGHMTKAMRMMEENLRLVDAVVYVLDARAPFSCINPDFESMIAGLPLIYILNKAELGDKTRIKQWCAYLNGENKRALALSATASKSALPILNIVRELCGAKIEKYRKKGIRTSIRCMVLGVPNTGKSTIINNICGSGKTVTGNKAGVTRGKQWVRVNDYLEMLDTPGTLYPKLSDRIIAHRLAYIGCIKDEILDIFALTCSLTSELNAIDPGLIMQRYKLAEQSEGEACIEAIARARGYVLKGGEPDTERAAVAFLDDFRKGKIGAVTFDTITEA